MDSAVPRRRPASQPATEGQVDTSERSIEDPVEVAERYSIKAVLGRGGMGAAYRVLDQVTGDCVALKVLSRGSGRDSEARASQLFEREYYTLNNLTHPRIVRAYDYGVDEGRPYYTMELLDGGDLQAAAPMPWPQACVAAYEVCSALSLLHSRKLVHRDLTPRNIRLTSDGKAKLIDFGLLSPVGPISGIAGTPPYTAPEALNLLSVDGRSDLFALGATLYFALTRRPAFPARKFSQLRSLWGSVPRLPSAYHPEIPEALDHLVSALLRIDPASRPKTAAEVMDRLRPLLPQAPDEELTVARAYLTSPQLVGRDDVIIRLRKQVLRTLRGGGGGFVVQGVEGSGRTRVLDAFVLEAKLLGAAVARAGCADAALGPFGVAQALARQIHDAGPVDSLAAAKKDESVFECLFEGGPSPQLVDLTKSPTRRGTLQAALLKWLIECAGRRALAIAVDDLAQADEPSIALLAALAVEARRHRLVYAVVTGGAELETASRALRIVQEVGQPIELGPLSAEDTSKLLRGVFGEPPNLEALAQQLHPLSGGLPGDCMALAQHLVDDGTIQYASGVWSLPDNADVTRMPARLQGALDATLASLSESATRVGQLLSLAASQRLGRAEFSELVGDRGAIDSATEELRAAQVLLGDPDGYRIANPRAASLLLAKLDGSALAKMHDTLADFYHAAGAHVLSAVFHRLQGELPARGLDLLVERASDAEARVALVEGGRELFGDALPTKTIRLAFEQVQLDGRRDRDRVFVWSMLAGLSALGMDAQHYYSVPDRWLTLLTRDSGLDAYHGLRSEPDATARAIAAFVEATQAYEALPEEQRVQAPSDAIRMLVAYVVISIAVGVRTLDLGLLSRLPGLLEPLAPLNPVVGAMAGNARATLANAMGQRQVALDLFVQVLAQLQSVEDGSAVFLNKIRSALKQTVSELRAVLGLESDGLDDNADGRDSNQRVGAEYVKKIVALHRGDWDGAESHRQRAELIALQNNTPMFSTLEQELEAHAFARDLTGLRFVRKSIERMAAKHGGWVPVLRAADAYYHQLCGDAERALEVISIAKAEQATAEIKSPWMMHVTGVEVGILAERGQGTLALKIAIEALETCERNRQHHLGRIVSWAAAGAEAALGLRQQAASRIARVIERQLELGVSGLLLGKSYEVQARLAGLAGDEAALEQALCRVADHYKPGESSVLGALYHRLVEDLRQSDGDARLDDAPQVCLDGLTETSQPSSVESVAIALGHCVDPKQRARRVLELLCRGDPPRRGSLFLCTQEGLVLSATTVPSADPAAFARFAQAQLELQQDDGTLTQSAELSTADLEEELESEAVTCGNNERYLPLLLRAERDGVGYCVGVALLPQAGRSIHRLTETAAQIARHLIASGDYTPVRVL